MENGNGISTGLFIMLTHKQKILFSFSKKKNQKLLKYQEKLNKPTILVSYKEDAQVSRKFCTEFVLTNIREFSYNLTIKLNFLYRVHDRL